MRKKSNFLRSVCTRYGAGLQLCCRKKKCARKCAIAPELRLQECAKDVLEMCYCLESAVLPVPERGINNSSGFFISESNANRSSGAVAHF